MPTHIRPARPSELPRLRDIEVAAGAAFREVGLPDVADDEPPSLDVLDGYRRGGRCWVAVVLGPVGYVLVDLVDAGAHIAQVSVHPTHAGRRIGQALVDHVDVWAAARGLAALTLTTFTDVPWNGPYYRRLGFRPVTTLTPDLAAIVAHETTLGLDPAVRTCLIRPTAGSDPDHPART